MQQNFKDDNVVESFFKKGAYAANQKERAEQDFIQAVIHCGDAKNEMNEDVFNWANDMIIKDRFRVCIFSFFYQSINSLLYLKINNCTFIVP